MGTLNTWYNTIELIVKMHKRKCQPLTVIKMKECVKNKIQETTCGPYKKTLIIPIWNQLNITIILFEIYLSIMHCR